MEEGIFGDFLSSFEAGKPLNASLAGVLRQFINDMLGSMEATGGEGTGEEPFDLTLEGLRRACEKVREAEGPTARDGRPETGG